MEKDKFVYLACCFKLALDEHNRIDHIREVGGYIPYDEEERYILDNLRNQSKITNDNKNKMEII